MGKEQDGMQHEGSSGGGGMFASTASDEVVRELHLEEDKNDMRKSLFSVSFYFCMHCLQIHIAFGAILDASIETQPP